MISNKKKFIEHKNKISIKLITHNSYKNTVPLRGPPRYNPRRRSGLGCWYNYHLAGSDFAGPTSSISSSSSWTNSHYHTFARLMTNGPPSPCPSDQPFNSASSSLSESSSSHRSQEDDISIVTGKVNRCNKVTVKPTTTLTNLLNPLHT